MTLSADQTAMLELLLDGGQDYEELADLFGLEQAEVRERARAALAEIGGADPNRNAPLSDYLLGKADPIDRADAVRRLKEDPDDHALAERILAGLAEIAPEVELIKLPPAPGAGRFLRKPPGSSAHTPTSAKPKSSTALDDRQKRLIAILGGGAIVLIVAILAITGTFGGGDDDSTGTSTEASALDSSTGTDASGNDFATIPLKAPSGDATGKALIGVASGDQAYVDVSIENLEPAQKGDTYVIWMMLTKNKGYPLTPIATNEDGTFHDRYAIPAAVVAIVARVQNVNVSLAKVSEVRTELKAALKNTSVVINRLGETVLDGPVPKSEQTTTPPAGDASTPDAGTQTPGTTAPEGTTTPDAGTETPDASTPEAGSTPDSSTGG